MSKLTKLKYTSLLVQFSKQIIVLSLQIRESILIQEVISEKIV